MGALDGKAVIVTGAAAGLGRAYAIAAADAGAGVVVADVDAAGADAVVAEIAARGGRATAFAGSVTSWTDMERLAARCVDAYGSLDGVVANAAIMHMAEPWDEEQERLRRIVEVNVLGVQFTVRHAMRAMVEAGRGGSIVTIVSGAQHGIRGMSAYGATKGAVTAMTANWAIEGEPHGIRVNALSPWAMTPMTAAHMDRNGKAASEFPEPDEIAPAVVALLSDRTAAVTGRSFRFDGARLGTYVTRLEPVTADEGWTTDAMADAMAGAIAVG